MSVALLPSETPSATSAIAPYHRARRWSIAIGCGLATTLLTACMTSGTSTPEPLAAHPTVPVETSSLSAPATAGEGASAELDLPAPPPTLPPVASGDGPMTLHSGGAQTTASIETNEIQMPSPPAAEPELAAAPGSARLGFLSWFGNNHAARRAPNPAAELRRARDITAAQEPDTASDGDAGRYPGMVGENSRLVPTYSDGLPAPIGQPSLQASGNTTGVADPISTGSLAAPEPAAQPSAPPSESVTVASAAPATAPAQAAPARGLPTRTAPSTLPFFPGQATLDEQQRAELDRIALAWQPEDGDIHIFGVARGVPVSRSKGSERIRRLMSHTGAAARYLRTRGVSADRMVLKTMEERIPQRYFGSDNPADQDRLDIFVE